MTPDTSITDLEIDGSFVPAQQLAIPESPCVLSEKPTPTLALKDNNLFLVTDTLGNISGYLSDDKQASMGLFCNDTRFLSRLEFQIDGRSPVLLRSTAAKGFSLSVLATNPVIKDRLRPDTLGAAKLL